MTFSKRRSKVHIFLVILAGLIGLGALVNGYAQSKLLPLSSNRQTHQPEAQHQYIVESGWNGCGFIPYEGWEGCSSQTGTILKSSDGAKVYFVKEHCTSSKAAKNEERIRLTGPKEAASKWQIKQQIPIDDALLVELAIPVHIGLDESVTSNWVCLWIADSTLVLIYGSDREHVEEYFNIQRQR
jgi:hypothetical protein